MQVSHIKISNILGVESLELTPGKFTAIVGPNGSGKTSVLEAIQAALRGGHDATLLRKGASQGEVVLVLEDGTEITKRVTAQKSDTIVRDPVGARVSSPGQKLKALTDALSVNPVEFLTAPKKDRVTALLEAMPIELPYARVKEIAGFDAPKNLPALDALDYVHKQLYDERTGTNRAIKEKKGTINQLLDALPEAGQVPPDVSQVRDELDGIFQARDAEIDGINQKLEKVRAKFQGEIEAIRADALAAEEEIQRKIAELQQELNDAKLATSQAIGAKKSVLQEQEGKAEGLKQEIRGKYEAQAANLRTQLENADAITKQRAKAEQAMETVKLMQEEAAELEETSIKITESIEALEALKSELLESLPIPGLEVRDGEVFRNGISFDRLNEAQRVQIAVELSKLRAGELGIICVDGIEKLDEASYEAFKEAALETDIQFVVTRVDDDEFSVETDGEVKQPPAKPQPEPKASPRAPRAPDYMAKIDPSEGGRYSNE